MDGGRPQESLRVAVQCNPPSSIGVTVVMIEFAGHSDHTRRRHMVLLLTLYLSSGVESTVQLARWFVSVKVTVFHKTIVLGDFSCL